MELTDTELRERLLAFGYASPPITNTSRKLLIKKLESLETGSKMKPSGDSNVIEDDDDDINATNNVPTDYGSINKTRYRSQKLNFIPENIGMYSRCFARHIDFWDKIGFFGTSILLVLGSIILFLIFISVIVWSDRRFRSVYVNEPVLPKCSQGGVTSITCVSDADLKSTVDNLNIIRSAIHQATVTDRCARASHKSNDFVGMFPLFRDTEVVNLLVQHFRFKEEEAQYLLKNAKVLFKANPQYDIKVLNEGILYKNYRLLRTCSYVSWNDTIYQYVICAMISFTVITIVYKVHRWVNKLRNEGDQERRRLIKDIIDVLKQNEKFSDTNYISVRQVHDWIMSAVQLKPKLWEDVMKYVCEHDTGIVIEKRTIRGQQCDVFRLSN